MTPSQPFLGLDPQRHALSTALADDIALLDSMVGRVLSEQHETAVLDLARRLYAETDADPRTLFERMPELDDPHLLQRVIRAFTVLFQLMNTAEQKEIVRVNRQRQVQGGASPRTESIADAVETLRAAGRCWTSCTPSPPL